MPSAHRDVEKPMAAAALSRDTRTSDRGTGGRLQGHSLFYMLPKFLTFKANNVSTSKVPVLSSCTYKGYHRALPSLWSACGIR